MLAVKVTDSDTETDALKQVLRKVTRRLIPFLFLLYVFAYLDRVNVGFAAAGMQQALGFSNSVYGAGAGIFFLGYALFEIPSNLLLLRVGPRRWIGGLMVVWGVLSTAMLLVHTATEFYLDRLLLGISEAGFFPGVILYLTLWFPQRERARAVARFMAATAVAGLLGSPASSLLLRLGGRAHLAGWQWLFLAEGVPSILLGIAAMWTLTEGPEQAAWLTGDERLRLRQALEAEARDGNEGAHLTGLRSALISPAVWVLGAIYFCLSFSLYTLSLWLPLMVRSMGGGARLPSEWRVGVWSSLPYGAAVLTMLFIAGWSDRTGRRRLPLMACLLCACCGYVASVATQIAVLELLALCVVAVGTWGAMGPFWALPASRLSGDARAGGIALINSVGALGGFSGPLLLGVLRDRTHSFTSGLLLAAVMLLAGAALAFGALREPRRAGDDTTGQAHIAGA